MTDKSFDPGKGGDASAGPEGIAAIGIDLCDRLSRAARRANHADGEFGIIPRLASIARGDARREGESEDVYLIRQLSAVEELMSVASLSNVNEITREAAVDAALTLSQSGQVPIRNTFALHIDAAHPRLQARALEMIVEPHQTTDTKRALGFALLKVVRASDGGELIDKLVEAMRIVAARFTAGLDETGVPLRRSWQDWRCIEGLSYALSGYIEHPFAKEDGVALLRSILDECNDGPASTALKAAIRLD